ncbi:DUF6191 domain-containing protein [Streptomyces sp. BA2]|uniref:DUF6191 domain-containing protein n=1 Tax=Streptomyces sp. BA2 TaxID=436595 RepID=UPI00132C0E95|nr:hypothetical protein [Streptomyces sp. BA2]
MFNPIELFQPGRKHTHDEQKRLELSRVDVADGDPGRGPIDLTSGKVVVRVPQQAAALEPNPTAAAAAEPPTTTDTPPAPAAATDHDR